MSQSDEGGVSPLGSPVWRVSIRNEASIILYLFYVQPLKHCYIDGREKSEWPSKTFIFKAKNRDFFYLKYSIQPRTL